LHLAPIDTLLDAEVQALLDPVLEGNGDGASGVLFGHFEAIVVFPFGGGKGGASCDIESFEERLLGQSGRNDIDVFGFAKEVGPLVDEGGGVIAGIVFGQLEKRVLDVGQTGDAGMLLLHAPAAEHGYFVGAG